MPRPDEDISYYLIKNLITKDKNVNFNIDLVNIRILENMLIACKNKPQDSDCLFQWQKLLKEITQENRSKFRFGFKKLSE